MWVSPREVYVMANFHGYGFTRGTLIGRQVVYGSSSVFRESRSFCAHGSSGSSPGFSPPSRSMSAFEPPPTHGPVRSTLPSGSRAARPRPWARPPPGPPPPPLAARRAPAASATTTTRILFTPFLPTSATERRRPTANCYQLPPADNQLAIRLRRREAAGNSVLIVLQTDELHQIDVRPDVSRREPQLRRSREGAGVVEREVVDERPVVEAGPPLDRVQLIGMRRPPPVAP